MTMQGGGKVLENLSKAIQFKKNKKWSVQVLFDILQLPQTVFLHLEKFTHPTRHAVQGARHAVEETRHTVQGASRAVKGARHAVQGARHAVEGGRHAAERAIHIVKCKGCYRPAV